MADPSRQARRRVEITDDAQLAGLRAKVLLVELRDLSADDRPQAVERLADGGDITDVFLGIGVEFALEQPGAEHAGLGAHLFQGSQPFLLEHLELVGRQRRLAEDLAQEFKHRRERLALGLNREAHGARSGAGTRPAPPTATASPAARARAESGDPCGQFADNDLELGSSPATDPKAPGRAIQLGFKLGSQHHYVKARRNSSPKHMLMQPNVLTRSITSMASLTGGTVEICRHRSAWKER
jgi:hypothetical protein